MRFLERLNMDGFPVTQELTGYYLSREPACKLSDVQLFNLVLSLSIESVMSTSIEPGELNLDPSLAAT